MNMFFYVERFGFGPLNVWRLMRGGPKWCNYFLYYTAHLILHN